MPNLTTVTLGTDGNVDYAEMSDGTRYVLGTVSVLQLVTSLVTGTRRQREALALFNKTKEAMVVLDPDAFFALLAPKRSRWAASSLIPAPDQEAPFRGLPMNPKTAFDTKVSYIEAQAALLRRDPSVESLRNLQAAVASISLSDFGDQSKNDAFMGLGQPKVDTIEDPGSYSPPASVTHPLGKTASYRAFQANTKVADEIMACVSETEEKIDSLVQAGKQFNAAKARGDLLEIVAALADRVRDLDLAQPWVADELAPLAKRASDIHALFAPAKV